MKVPLRDVRELPLRAIVDKGVYGIRRRTGRAPEHAAARRLAEQWRERGIEGGSPEVLIFSPRDWSMQVQWESVLGHALRLRGASVSVLGCAGGLEVCDHNNCYRSPPMPCGSCVRYTRDASAAHGLDRDELVYDGVPDWPELDAMSVDELYQVEWEGLPLGELVRIPSQWFNMTTRVHEDPLAAASIRRFLRSGRRVAAAVERQLDAKTPDVVVMLNGLLFFESILREICRRREIEHVTYEVGFVPGTLVFEHNDVSAYFDRSRWWDEWVSQELTPAEDARLTEFQAARRTGGQTADTFWLDASFTEVDRKRTGSLAVMFTNLTWDTAVIGQEIAFDSVHDWIATAIEHFEHRPDDELVVRIHPGEVKLRGAGTREPVEDLIRARFPVLPPNVRIISATDTTSSYTLMAQADVGLVYTSTTGLELALAGTPVLVAGETHYRRKGFTEDVEDREGFRTRLDAILDDPGAFAPDVARARKYASLFLFAGPYEFPFVGEPVQWVPELLVQDLAELEPGRNADLDRICDAILGRTEFHPVHR